MREQVGWLRERLQGRVAVLMAFMIVADVLVAVVLSPLSTGALALCLHRWGRWSIGNFELASFLLSPIGALAVMVVGTVTIGAVYFQLAGVMLLLTDRQRGIIGALGELLGRGRDLAELAGRQLATLLLLAVPFVIVGGVVVVALWRGRDLNGLLVLKPAAFWVGAGVAAALGAGYAVLVGRWVLRWYVALPLLMFDASLTARQALVASAAVTLGRRRAILRDLAGWALVQVIAAALLTGALSWAGNFVLDRVGLTLAWVLPITGAFVVAHLVAGLALSIFASVTLGGWMLACGARFGAVTITTAAAAQVGRPMRLTMTRWRVGGGIVVALAISMVASAVLLNRTELEDGMEFTAHRGGALIAPENTVAAIRAAIAARADWAEIDVQRSADGALVVVHDADLRRVADDPRRVADLTLAELREVDVGRSFDAAHVGERIPTLAEVVAAAGDAVRLNIELKPAGSADVEPLVRGVLEVVGDAGSLGRYRVCGQSYEGLQLVRQLAPEVEIGFIAGAALGNLASLDVDFLMVEASMARRRLIDAARARGMEVHAWTVNDSDQLVPLLDRGVANLITDDPGLMRARLAEVRALHPAARLLLRTRNLLAD